MNCKIPFPQKSILFAPMEGITDNVYRSSIKELYPEWDLFYTDFLRMPAVGKLKSSRIKSHLKEDITKTAPSTCLQILTTAKVPTDHFMNEINCLNIQHLDLNIGCPSRTVNSHGGGSYLLSDLKLLEIVIKNIRSTFPHFLSAKIRVGYKDDTKYTDILKLLEAEGVNQITVHARTRDQLYKGVADWKYIKKAVETVSIPIVGNGDIWSAQDIDKIFHETGCHSVMIARGAMKTPWLAKNYKEKLSPSEELQVRQKNLPIYFNTMANNYKKIGKVEDVIILKRLKAISRYIFDDLENGPLVKRNCLRSKSLEEFFAFLPI
jgi:tRNA-dihydrouridine synthase